MDVTLEHVLVAAKERRAPVTPETAGYIALAIADTVLASPALVREADVRLHDDGAVALIGAQRADEGPSERSVRVLLGKLLHVAVGSAPALVNCVRNHGEGSVQALVRELEAALVPVNRSAARRAIARLAREASRIPETRPSTTPQSDRPPEAPAPAPRRPAVRRPPAEATPAMLVGVLESASEPEYEAPQPPPPTPPPPTPPPPTPPPPTPPPPTPAPAWSEPAIADATEVDAPVAAKPEVAPPPPMPEPPADHLGFTPKLTTYDPSASHAAPPPVVAILRAESKPGAPVILAGSVSGEPPKLDDDPSGPLMMNAPAFGEVVEADIPTPSIAIDVESRGEGELPVLDEAAHASVVDVPSLEVPPATTSSLEATSDFGDADLKAEPSPQPPAESLSEPSPQPPAESLSEPAKSPAATSAPVEEPAAESSDGTKPDRVGELLSSFGTQRERSSREVAGDLKHMLGLPPTPPPPQTESVGHDTPGAAATGLVGSEDEATGEGHEPAELVRLQSPKRGLGLSVVLLVLALGVLAALWRFYPQIFVGH